MNEIYFFARHIPFWATALFVLGGEFGYVFWLKKKKKAATMFFMLALIGFSCNIFYIWAGGPEKTVKFLKKMHRDNN
jgi:hypothetical protein